MIALYAISLMFALVGAIIIGITIGVNIERIKARITRIWQGLTIVRLCRTMLGKVSQNLSKLYRRSIEQKAITIMQSKIVTINGSKFEIAVYSFVDKTGKLVENNIGMYRLNPDGTRIVSNNGIAYPVVSFGVRSAERAIETAQLTMALTQDSLFKEWLNNVMIDKQMQAQAKDAAKDGKRNKDSVQDSIDSTPAKTQTPESTPPQKMLTTLAQEKLEAIINATRYTVKAQASGKLKLQWVEGLNRFHVDETFRHAGVIWRVVKTFSDGSSATVVLEGIDTESRFKADSSASNAGKGKQQGRIEKTENKSTVARSSGKTAQTPPAQDSDLEARMARLENMLSKIADKLA